MNTFIITCDVCGKETGRIEFASEIMIDPSIVSVKDFDIEKSLCDDHKPPSA